MTARDSTSPVHCDGWWDEAGYGRQPMLELQLRIGDGRITGSGRDIIGPFTFSGVISAGGGVAMIKQYLGQHQVEYAGTYDGEGTMFGEWRIGPYTDRWMISFQRPRNTSARRDEEVQVIE